ncbi:hypothetical protein ACWCXH_24355 [Kitasatospora sp. NPDC001660]
MTPTAPAVAATRSRTATAATVAGPLFLARGAAQGLARDGFDVTRAFSSPGGGVAAFTAGAALGLLWLTAATAKINSLENDGNI